MSDAAAQREEIRRCIQRYYGERSSAKLRSSAVAAHLEDEGHRVKEDHLERELDFLTRDGWLEKSFPSAGHVPRYQATPKLVLAIDRREL